MKAKPMNDDEAENGAKMKALDDAVVGNYYGLTSTIPIKPLSLADYQDLMFKLKPPFDGAPKLVGAVALIGEVPRSPLAAIHSSFQAALDALPISAAAAHRHYAQINRRYVVCWRMIDTDGIFKSGVMGLLSGGMAFADAYARQRGIQRIFACYGKDAKGRCWLEVVK